MTALDGRLLAVSDMHISHPENRRILEEQIVPRSLGDRLLVAGNVNETAAEIELALALLRDRFAEVVWVPGNHELWTPREDPVQLREEERYRHLVEVCRRFGVLTPEDPYPVWRGTGGPVIAAPLFVLYDYSFRAEGLTKEESLAAAYEAGVVCADEFLLYPYPYPYPYPDADADADADTWCQARVKQTQARLDAIDQALPTVLVNHFPLVREVTEILRHPEFAQWCGIGLTADWHRRYRVTAVVYGHLYIPRTTFHHGIRFDEVSIGYPRKHRHRGLPRGVLRNVRRPQGHKEEL